MNEVCKLRLNEVLQWIQCADELDIQDAMPAIENRFASNHSDWDVFYVAVHKDPVLRAADLKKLTDYIEKDIAWHKEKQKEDSLGCEGVLHEF